MIFDDRIRRLEKIVHPSLDPKDQILVVHNQEELDRAEARVEELRKLGHKPPPPFIFISPFHKLTKRNR